MRAIVIEKFGGPDGLVYTELPEPEPEAGYVVIQIKAFGLNHAEMHMRRGSRVFKFEQIRKAHRVMEANEAKGKMVVVVDGH
jgi:threonine dehydrogenase-like Zn-dependent dehydrogenase